MKRKKPTIRGIWQARSMLAAACLLPIALAGCVTRKVAPEHQPRLMIAQDSDGVVTLRWESEPGYKYRIDVMDPETNTWKPLENAGVFHGNGETIVYKERRNPRKPAPWYNLRYSRDD